MTQARKTRPTSTPEPTRDGPESPGEPERRVNLTLTIAAASTVARHRLTGEALSVAVSRLLERLDAIEQTLTVLGRQP